MALQYMDPELIKEHPNNPRIISKEELDKLVESLRGFPEMMEKRPVVINAEGYALGGNMRTRASVILKKEGHPRFQTIPIDPVDWSEEKQKEFMLKDNIQAGEWDFDAMEDSSFPTHLLGDTFFTYTSKEGLHSLFTSEKEEPGDLDNKQRKTLKFRYQSEIAESIMKHLSSYHPNPEKALLKALGL